MFCFSSSGYHSSYQSWYQLWEYFSPWVNCNNLRMLQLSFLMETIILAGMKKGGKQEGNQGHHIGFCFHYWKRGSYWRFPYSRSRNNFSQGHFGLKDDCYSMCSNLHLAVQLFCSMQRKAVRPLVLNRADITKIWTWLRHNEKKKHADVGCKAACGGSSNSRQAKVT